MKKHWSWTRLVEIVKINAQYQSGRYDFLKDLKGHIALDFADQVLTFELSSKQEITQPIKLSFNEISHFEPQIHGTLRKKLQISLGYNAQKPGPPDLFQVKDSWVKIEDIEKIRDRIYKSRSSTKKSPVSTKLPFMSSIGEITSSIEKMGKSVFKEVAKVTSDIVKSGEAVVIPPPPKPPQMEGKFKEIFLPDLTLNTFDSSWEIGTYRRKGHPLIFLHGIGCGAWVWNHQLSRFSRKRRSVAYDLRGHGLSEHPKKGYEVSQHATDLVNLLNELNIDSPAILVSHSMSLMIAIQFALDNPDAVSAMIIVSGWASFPNDLKKGAKLIPPTSTWGPLKKKARRMAPEWILNDPESYLVEEIIPRIEKTPDRVLATSVKEFIRKSDYSKEIANINIPILLLRGSNDKLFKEKDANILIEGFPKINYEEIPNTCHFPQLERPISTYRLMSRFLKNQKL